MTYKFKENITHSEYEKFIKKRTDISYMQEDNWAKAKNIKKTLLDVTKKSKVVNNY